MKKPLLSLLCLSVGFLSARWIPGPGQSLAVPSPSSSTADANANAKPPLAKKPARSLDLTGDWKSSAEAWAIEDPAAFRDWLVERGLPPGAEVLRALFLEWVKQDPNAALEAALNLPADFKQDDHLLADLLSEALQGPAGLVTLLKWAPLAGEQIHSWGTPGDDWLKNTPPEVLAAQFKSISHGKSSLNYCDMLLARFSSHWASSDLPAALEWMKTLGPGTRVAAMDGIMSPWVEKDSQAALAYLAAEASSEGRFFAFKPLGKLAETDPRAAMDWWEENVGIPGRHNVRGIFERWCASNPEEARDYALSMEDPTLRKHTLQAWGESAKLGQVLEAVDASTDPETRTTLLSAKIKTTGDTSEGFDELQDQVKKQTYPEITPQMAATLAGYQSYREPAKALAWAASLPEDFQGPSVNQVISLWMNRDRIAAAQAVDNLPDGPSKTAALRILAHQ